MINRLKVLSRNRFIILFIFILVFMSFNLLTQKTLLPSTETKDLWFYSGLFMVLFSILFIEPYFSSPKNVLTNTIPLILVLIAIQEDLNNSTLWLGAIFVLFSLSLLSIAAIALEQPTQSPTSKANIVSNFIKRIVVFVGQGKVLYSAVFIYFLTTNYSLQSSYTQILFVTWAVIVMINPKKISSSFGGRRVKLSSDAIGEVFGVQSKRMFLVRVFDDKKSIRRFDLVKFSYSMHDTPSKVLEGFVFDTYLLNQEKWAKVLHIKSVTANTKFLKDNVVYKVSDSAQKSKLITNLQIDSFAGVVIEGSRIAKIKFEYSKKENNIEEGDLLELYIGKRRLFYQVIGGVTENEVLEAKNETGFIQGEAIQLGEWQSDKLSFQKFGWLPEINTPLFVADTSNISVDTFEHPEHKLGVIPGTQLPSVINLDDAVSHHMALLGVTGSGKSHLARKIIQLLQVDTKVIVVDLTGEWATELVASGITSTALGGGNLETFLNDDSQRVGVVGIPTMSNTTGVLEQTQKLFENIFKYAKEKYEAGTITKIALVLEEAHTIVPETSFLGDFGDYSANKALVNKMGQIALQGRKYGVGMVIIAQRTANVSKTVLTQCNTVICFQAFDETSFTFLSNYIGKELVGTLPNLKQYHAIVTGKALKSNIPMIVDMQDNA